ncbi:hypothetical protein [Actinomadura rugatobispora]|uniref:Uncharacterized protein n=1 Tax=Actinomadura rugatobispora TaxID=1994 RepID=A0ABW0ZZC7_9ACTN|nr:hypothetical protein GCM10010200_090970 [Actinomadura rugatobispora]
MIVLVEHRTRAGASKIVEICTLPLTGASCVHRIITGLAVIDVPGGLVLAERAPASRPRRSGTRPAIVRP